MSATTWARFTKRTDDPKLAYLEGLLDERKIPHRRNGHSWHAPILEVEESRLEEAEAILSEKVEYDGAVIRLDDVPDDDERFVRG